MLFPLVQRVKLDTLDACKKQKYHCYMVLRMMRTLVRTGQGEKNVGQPDQGTSLLSIHTFFKSSRSQYSMWGTVAWLIVKQTLSQVCSCQFMFFTGLEKKKKN